MTRRWKSGQFARRPYMGGLLLMTITVLLGLSLRAYSAFASEPEVMVSPTPEGGAVSQTPLPSVLPQGVAENLDVVAPTEAEDEIKAYIREVFKENGEKAIKIAECESERDGQIQPSIVGDTDLMTTNNGEVVGDSIGVFQIRTGGKGWNRAKANGMTADEFRVYLKDYRKNVDYAKTIFDQTGRFGNAWVLCSKRTGVN